MRYIFGCILVLTMTASGGFARAENIVLRSGKKIEGRILERTGEFIKVDYSPAPLYYCWDSVASIDGQAVPGRTRKAQVSPEAEPGGAARDGDMQALLAAKDKEIEELRGRVEEGRQVKEDLAVLKQAFKTLQAKYYNNLGGMYLYEKAFEDAAAAFEDALTIDPWNEEACFNLALVYDNYMHDTKTAVNFYERYLILVPAARDRPQIEARIAQLKS
jgi:tetratricopeptide (TPR) repeat protein